MVRFPCGHAACEACTARWLSGHDSCVMCRASVLPPAAHGSGAGADTAAAGAASGGGGGRPPVPPAFEQLVEEGLEPLLRRLLSRSPSADSASASLSRDDGLGPSGGATIVAELPAGAGGAGGTQLQQQVEDGAGAAVGGAAASGGEARRLAAMREALRRMQVGLRGKWSDVRALGGCQHAQECVCL
jgi:hypothetical protein